jgi:hypothetical protein
MVPVLPLGIVMRRLPPRVADALAWPIVRSTVGDVTKVGLKKLPYGPNTPLFLSHSRPSSVRISGLVSQLVSRDDEPSDP